MGGLNWSFLKRSVFIDSFTGELYAQFFEDLYIYIREKHRCVRLAAVKLRELREGKSCFGIGRSAGGEGDQYFIRMQPRVLTL